MDPTLLQKPNRQNTNDEHEHPEAVTARQVEPAPDVETNFRDIAVDEPKPPCRLKINPPLEYDGEKYGELIFDFDAMNGKDFQRAEREFNRLYKPDKNEMVLPEMKHLYHCIIAAHRADVPLGVILKLPRRYYTPLRLEVLKACGSSPDEENE